MFTLFRSVRIRRRTKRICLNSVFTYYSLSFVPDKDLHGWNVVLLQSMRNARHHYDIWSRSHEPLSHHYCNHCTVQVYVWNVLHAQVPTLGPARACNGYGSYLISTTRWGRDSSHHLQVGRCTDHKAPKYKHTQTPPPPHESHYRK